MMLICNKLYNDAIFSPPVQKYLLILPSNFHLNISQNKKLITLSNFLKLLRVTFSPSIHSVCLFRGLVTVRFFGSFQEPRTQFHIKFRRRLRYFCVYLAYLNFPYNRFAKIQNYPKCPKFKTIHGIKRKV